MTDIKISLLLTMLICAQALASAARSGEIISPTSQVSNTDAVTTQSKQQAEKNEQTSPACPVSNPACNNTAPNSQVSNTDAVTTKSKQEAEKNEQTKPPCPVSNPGCNNTKENTSNYPSGPTPGEIKFKNH